MILPTALQNAVQQALGMEPGNIQFLGGSQWNQTVRLEAGQSAYLLKWRSDSPSGFFTAEAKGLAVLRAINAIRVPEVIAYAEANGDCPAYLIEAWITATSGDTSFGMRNFGRALAVLHQATYETHEHFGLDHDNFIGELPQPNTPTSRWIDFYREQRLRVQMELARQNGELPIERERLLNKVMDRLEPLLSGLEIKPSLLHGDLWSGNFLIAAGNQPVIFDPAVYYGHREVEIAFTELFGGFPRIFYQVYREAWPLDAGYEDRRALYQLYPLLVHVNLFGGGYGAQVDAVCRRYVG